MQGTYETFVEVGRRHYGGELGGQVDPDGGPRRHGRGAAAGGNHGRGVDAGRRVPTEPHRDAAADRLPRRAGARPRRGAGDGRALVQGGQAAVGWPARERRGCVPGAGQARRAAGRGDGPDLGPRSGQRLSAARAGALAEWETRRAADPTAVALAAKRSMAEHVRAMLGVAPARACPTRRLRQQHPPDGPGRGRGRRLRLPGLRAGLHPPAVLPRRRAVPLGRACRATRRTSAAPTPR